MSGKRKLQQFAEIKTFNNVLEVSFKEAYNKRHPLSGNWSTEVFKNDNPIVLELGCGKGEYTLGLARAYPDKNFIGIDIKGARMWRGAKTALDEGLHNVFFLRSRIEFVESFFDQGEVSEIWLTFPDPQPRKSRERKRLTSPRFLDKYAEFLQKDGLVHLKTDAHGLYLYSDETARNRKHEILISSPDIYAELNQHSLTDTEKEILQIRTFYESMFTEKGHVISYLKFRM